MRYSEIYEGSMGRMYDRSRRQPIEQNKAFEYIRNNCSSALAATPIYRGAKTQDLKSGSMFVDTTSSVTRLSANTKSYVSILMDNLENWKAYPKRGKSLICSNDPGYAANYGTLYRVFPVNGTRIGICPNQDLWFSFKFRNVPLFNSALDALSEHLLKAPLSETPTEFFKQLNAITEKIDNIGGMDRLSLGNSLKYIISESNKLGTNDMKIILASLVDPETNGFKVMPIEEMNQYDSTSHELWFSGKAILIPIDDVDALERFLKLDNITIG